MQGVQVQSLIGELGFPHASGSKKQNRKQKQYCNKFNKDQKKKKKSTSKKSLKKQHGKQIPPLTHWPLGSVTGACFAHPA